MPETEEIRNVAYVGDEDITCWLNRCNCEELGSPLCFPCWPGKHYPAHAPVCMSKMGDQLQVALSRRAMLRVWLANWEAGQAQVWFWITAEELCASTDAKPSWFASAAGEVDGPRRERY